MDDVTDTVFRRVIIDCARPDLCITEFVNADGLQSPGRRALLKKLQFTPAEQPLTAQIWGKVPENFYKTARQIADGTLLEELNARSGQADTVQGTSEARSKTYGQVRRASTGASDTAMRRQQGRVSGSAGKQAPAVPGFAGIDINMGCPDKTVLKNGCCAALVDNRELAKEIILATKAGANGKLPVSVKTRLGLGSVDLTWHEFLLGFDLDALLIHGRTARQMSDVPADWNMIAQVRQLRDRLSPRTKLIGNGDVLNRQQGLELAEKHGVDGIMIGRGIFQDPFAFAAKSPWPDYGREQRIALYRRHVELFAATWQVGERKVHTLNKFCKIYINGFDGAKEFREQCMQARSAEELLRILTV